MGRSIPVEPEKYRPRSVILLQQKLTRDILDWIDNSGLTSAQITAMIRASGYTTFRTGYIAWMRKEGLFGVSRLLQICEALGIILAWQTVRTQRQQTRISESEMSEAA